MNPTDENLTSHLPASYTKDLHLKHVEAFWEGKLEWFNQFSDEWAKSINPPHQTENPARFRIATTKHLRPWKPEELPLGAWICDKGNLDYSLIVACVSGMAVQVDSDGFCKISPTHLLENFQHSTDQGKTWLPCGVEE
jgi:hypothetical protein